MRARFHLPVLAGLLIGAAGLPLTLLPVHSAGSPTVVISQVYGGGGNSGAQYSNKFVELLNRGGATASLAGWSIQYASATGTANFAANVVTLPAVEVPAGGYFLVQLAGGLNGSPLPTPDATGTINPAATAGKVVLASTPAGLACNGASTPCDASQVALIADLVGYGSANYFEGSAAAPSLSNTTAAVRRDGGCSDTDDNAADFSAAAPVPRNSASPINPCTPDEPSPTTQPTAEPTTTPEPTPEPTPTPEHSPAPSPAPSTFAFDGFGPPLANPPAVNGVKAGSSVVLHFSLGGDYGLDVIAAGYPVSLRRTCTGSAEDAAEIAGSPGASGLSYEPATDVYTYVWKTDRAWAGTCRRLVLKLTDESFHLVEFTFR